MNPSPAIIGGASRCKRASLAGDWAAISGPRAYPAPLQLAGRAAFDRTGSRPARTFASREQLAPRPEPVVLRDCLDRRI